MMANMLSTGDGNAYIPPPPPDFFEASRKDASGLSLQKTFTAEGDIVSSPVSALLLSFTYRPATVALQAPGDSLAVNFGRSSGVVSTSTLQELRDPAYIAGIGLDSFLPVTTGDTPFDFLQYYNQCSSPNQIGFLDKLALAIDVTAFSDEDIPLGKLQSFRALFALKNYCDTTASGNPFDASDAHFTRENPGAAVSFIERNAFLINRDSFDELANSIIPPIMQPNLLHIITYLTDLSSGTPQLLGTQSEYARLIINQQAGMIGKDAADLISAITQHFDALMDFPVSTGSIKLQQAGGTFTITGADDLKLMPADFAVYDISLEYEALDENGDAELTDLHLDWSTTTEGDKPNTVNFSFSDSHAIVPSEPHELMMVSVRTPDGMVLWQKDFVAGSAALGSMHISVPLQGNGAIKPSERNITNSKRLRGQILDMTRTALLTNALVLIQVKSTGDTEWRNVGSALADKDGYFSLPYPFGNFMHGRAVVSLNPHSPVAIHTHALTADNQTLADDFIFLQLNSIHTPEVAADSVASDDCDCQDNLKATRLPDQADLIHSDEYTQDLGAGCINLSTPNRTLREYPYNAIVRTSDPDVANYTLVKVDEKGNYTLQGEGKKRKRRAVDLSNPVQWQDAPDKNGITSIPGTNGDGATQDFTIHNTNLSFYQAVTVSTGHILHYKAQFKADGYSLGELLYSLPLAPGQKKQIVVFDSSHQLQGSETQQLSVQEQLANNLVNDRDITDQLSGSISENLSGKSKAETAGVSAAAGASGSTGAFGASVGVAGGYAMGSSDASQDSARNISQFFNEKLRNGLMQNADSYRQQNASVITTVAEGQKYSATTEVVANHNHCHSLTMMYFEVLKHYAIYQELSNVEECVFVPLLLSNFTQQNVMKWRDVLASNLLSLPSNTYLPSVNGQHPLAPAFDANERVMTNWLNVDYPEYGFDDEPVRNIKGSLALRVMMQRPKTRYDRILTFPLVEKTTGGPSGWDVFGNILLAPFTGGIPVLGLDQKTSVVRQQIYDSFMQLDAGWQSAAPADCIRVINFESVQIPSALLASLEITGTYSVSGSNFFEDGYDSDRQAWTSIAKILGFQGNNGVYDMLNKYFKGKLISEWDTIYYRDIAPELVEKLVHSLRLTEADDNKNAVNGISPSFSALNRYGGGEAVIYINVFATLLKPRDQFANYLMLRGGDGVSALQSLVTLRLENVSLRYSTAHFDGILYEGYLGQDIFAGATMYIPETAADKRNPRQEDRFIVTRLLDHLNSNLEYYNKTLWYNLDADRRYMLVDGFHIQVYNDNGVPMGLKSLASVIKNELVTVAGNSLVFPVAAGFRVGRSYLIEQTDTDGAEKVTLLDHYKPITPASPFRLSVPTKGLFVEAVKGQCDACEKVEENTSQDWDKFKTDEPTTINALTAPTPTVTDWKATFKDIASATLRVQDAPTTPAPGAGMAGLSDALTKANVFNDVTGLEGNQKNAASTYKANMEAAVKIAESTKDLATQENSTANNEQITKSIKDAVKNGDISKDAGQKLLEKHYGNVVDGGSSAREEAKQAAAKEKNAKPSLTDSAIAGASANKAIKATKTDSDGNTETVEIGSTASTSGSTGTSGSTSDDNDDDDSDSGSTSGKGADTVLAQTDIAVPLITQTDSNSCWAAASAMMLSWKIGCPDLQHDGQVLPMGLSEAVKMAGSQYVTILEGADGVAPTGLHAADKFTFVRAIGMVTEDPGCYEASFYIKLMNDYGPLWLTCDATADDPRFSPHAKVLFKITGTSASASDITFYFNDPAQTTTPVKMSFADFTKSFDEVAKDSKSERTLDQIVHFADKGLWKQRVDWAAVAKEVKDDDAAADVEHKAALAAGFTAPADVADTGEGYKVSGSSGTDYLGKYEKTAPVHETLTLAALLDSKFAPQVPKGTRPPTAALTGNVPEINEFFRGVVWNDDPGCLLFDQGWLHRNENMNYALGTSWLWHYHEGSKHPEDLMNITGRSHYGDMQWLHSMAMKDGEDPITTRAWIMMWLEFTYGIAITAADTPDVAKKYLHDTNITGTDAAGQKISLSTVFNNAKADPDIMTTVGGLFLRDSQYVKPMLDRRALGSMLHTIQDSYSKAHVKRKLTNPYDLLSMSAGASQIEFLPDAYGKLGAIQNIHSYGPVNEATHAHWDIFGSTIINAYDIKSFNRMVGARDAIDRSSVIIDKWMAKAPWAEVRDYLLANVYNFDTDISASAEKAD